MIRHYIGRGTVGAWVWVSYMAEEETEETKRGAGQRAGFAEEAPVALATLAERGKSRQGQDPQGTVASGASKQGKGAEDATEQTDVLREKGRFDR